MDREHYISEAERQLNDSTFHKALDHDPTNEFAKKVADAVSEMLYGDHIMKTNQMPAVITSYPRFITPDLLIDS